MGKIHSPCRFARGLMSMWWGPGLIAAGVATATASASPTDAAIVAVMKLPEQPSYSWVCSISSGNTGAISTIMGETDKDGYTTIADNNPTPLLLRRLGPGSGGTVNAVFKGDDLCVIQTGNGWKFPDELPKATAPSSSYGSGGGGGGGRRGRRGAMGAFGGGGEGDSAGGEGNGGGSRQGRAAGSYELNFAIRHPAEEMEIIVGGSTELTGNSDTCTGQLSERAAMQFMSSFGQPLAAPVHASGTFSIWMRDGIPARYEVTLDGTATVGSDTKELPVHWTISTEIRDVGKTKVDVVPEAKAKLDAVKNPKAKTGA
jgi:hypothetical protein